MVAVVPPPPKHQTLHGGRAPKAASGAADFGRFLQEASGEEPPAPAATRPEQGFETTPAPEERAPAAESETAVPAADGARPPAEGPATAEHSQAEEPETPEDLLPAPLPTAAQPTAPIVPLAPIVPIAPIAPAVPAEPATSSAAAQAALPAAALLAGSPPAGVPAPPAKPIKGLPQTEATGETGKTAGGDASPLALEIPPDLEAPTAENPAAKAPAQPGSQHTGADLLSFEELMRPDLQVDVAPEPILDQLQQAMNSALLEENAQVVMPQVVRGLATLVSEGISEMRLQLMPEDLGEIELRVRTSEGVVRAEMMVQNPEVKQLLDQHLDRLRQALHQQGLDLRGFDVDLSADGRFAQPDRSRHGSQPQGGTRRQQPDGATEANAPVLALRGAVEVDYLA